MGTKVLKTIAPTIKKPITLYLARFFIFVINCPFLIVNIKKAKVALKMRISWRLLG